VISFSERYSEPLWRGVIIVFAISVVASLINDASNDAFNSFLYSLGVYVLLVLLIMFRRPAAPTKVDLALIRLGLPLLYAIGLIVYPWVWRLRGL
jgi:hypothetical protein